MTITGHALSFLGSPGNTSISGTLRGQYVRNRLQEVEDNTNEEKIEEKDAEKEEDEEQEKF